MTPISNSSRRNRKAVQNVNLAVSGFVLKGLSFGSYNASKYCSGKGVFESILNRIYVYPRQRTYTPSNPIFLSLRSYRVESTASRPLCEVKLHWAGLVLRWVTTGELSGVVSIFWFFWARGVRVAGVDGVGFLLGLISP